MTYPANLTTVTATHKVVSGSGKPLTGNVYAVPAERVWATDGSIVEYDARVQIAADGTYELPLPHVDQAGVRNKGVPWKVTEDVPGQPRSFWVAPMVAHGTGKVDIATMLTSAPAGKETVIQAGPVTDAAAAGLLSQGGQFATALSGAIAAGVQEGTTEVRGRLDEILDASTNLFLLDTITPGHNLPAGSGTPAANVNYAVSAHIPARPSAAYSYRNVYRIVYYDAAGSYLKDDTLSRGEGLGFGTRTTPANTATVRLSIHNFDLNIAQMNEGDTILPYEPGRAATLNPELIGPAVRQEAAAEVAAAFPVDPARTTFFKASPNLFNLATITPNHTIPWDSSTPIPNNTYAVSAHIPVQPSQPYSYGHVVRVHYYKADGGYLKHDNLGRGPGLGSGTYTSPANAATARLTVHNLDLNIAQMNEGATLLPYQPGGESLKPEYAPSPGLGPWPGPGRYLLDIPGLDEPYTAPTIADMPSLADSTTADVHGWYEALRASHPNYVTREQIGQAAGPGAQPIYAYTFKAPPVPTDSSLVSNVPSPIPAALFVAGPHGYEKPNVHHTWRFAKALCDEWETSPMLDAIRWNVEVIIVPVVNPYSYDVSQRHNFNDVDIERNFSALWTPTAVNPGPAPLSEPESQAIDTLIQKVAARTVIGASLHNFTFQETPVMMWSAGVDELTMNVGKKHIARMSRKWRQEHEWVTIPGPHYGYTLPGASPGGAAQQMWLYGIPAMTYETNRVQSLDGNTGFKANYLSRAMTLGYEATANFFAQAIKAGIDRANALGAYLPQ